MASIALIKLGGSVVTFKDKPLTANHNAISKICSSIATLDRSIVLVHGGGSFGHYWSVRYDMHTAPKEYDSLGISKVHNSMLALNQIITDALIEQRARPYSIQPSVFTSGHRIIYSKIKELVQIAKKLIPVTFGDVIHVGTSKYSILSGDAIMTMLARALKPNKVIFATNVDGILRHESSKEIIREIRIGSKDTIEFDRPLGADVTGGMRRKVQEATTIAALGMDVHIVNGLHPERVIDAIEGKAVTGTVVTKRRTK